MLTIIFFLAVVASIVVFVVKFLHADGDFTLLSKKHAKREAIEDKVVWITGASRGIGEALAKECANLGAKLIISARNEVELQRVKQQLTGKHAPEEVVILPLDLMSGEDSLREAVEKAESFFSGAGVDYMIHNAAYQRSRATALDVNEENLKAVLDVNIVGTITLTQLLAPAMLRRGRGHFIVTSSAAAKGPAPGQAVYCATKAALNGYFHSLRAELRQKGINVTVICPGPIKASSVPAASASGQKGPSEKRVPSERCAELIMVAATHGLREAWISYQPVLGLLYVMQYMPATGYWLMDKMGAKRVEAAANKSSMYSMSLLFGKKKKAP